MTAQPLPDFPPLLQGQPVRSGDPFLAALAATRHAVEPGLIHYALSDDALRAAITLAPEVPLESAIGVVWAVQLGLADALGALVPPEVAVHFRWPDRLLVNGALCGRFRAVAATRDPLAEPDWLVVGVDLAILPDPAVEPGTHPDQTTLFAEGCGEITPLELLEAWSRHMLLWIHTYLDGGMAALHEDWCAKCDGLGQAVTQPQPGTLIGLDERGGLLLRQGDATLVLPLTQILEDT